MTEPPGSGWASPAWGEPAQPSPAWGEPSPSSPAWGTPTPASPGPPADPGPPGAPPGAAYGWAPPASAAKPGVVPLRPLGVGEILDGAITTIRRNAAITIGVAALVVTVQQLITVVAQLFTGSVTTTLSPLGGLDSPATANLDTSFPVVGAAVSAGNLVLSTVLGAVLTGILMVVVGDAVLGRKPVFAQVWVRVKPRFWALLGGSVLAGLLPFAGLLLAGVLGLFVGLTAGTGAGVAVGFLIALLMVVPAVYLWGVLALTTPAIALEQLGPLAGLRRSRQLAQPDFWRVWGIRALSTVIGGVLSAVIVAPFAAIAAFVALSGSGGDTPTGARLLTFLSLTSVGAIVAGAIVQPFLSGVLGLLYVDRRMRGEGLDIVLAESARTAGTTR